MDWTLQPVTALITPEPMPDTRASPADGAATQASGAFAALLERGVAEVERSLGAAEGAARDVAAGRPLELHEVMIHLERASLSVQVFLQVRNKLVESFQDLMRMQM